MRKLLAGFAGACVGIVVALPLAWLLGIAPAVTVAEGSHDLRLRAMTNVYEGNVGDECLPFGLVDEERSVWPAWRQVVVTNDVGAVVGVMDLTSGTVEEVRGGQLVCVVTATVPIPDAPFYTFTVDDAYKLTVPRGTLDAAGWAHEAFMG